MSNYPVFLNIAHFNCLVVGGGKVAARKVAHLLEAGAKPTIIAPELSAELEIIAQTHQLNVQLRTYEAADLQSFQLVIAATNNLQLNDAIARQAIDSKILVNNISSASLCNFQMPAVVRRQCIELAIGTGGELPYLSHRLKKYFEEQLTSEKLEILTEISQKRKEVLAKSKGEGACKKELLDAELSPLVDEFIRNLFV